MEKRQIFMLLIAIWLSIIISACRQSIQPSVNEENPVIVDSPRVSMTVFTNWQEVQLTYTIRWLDGYTPLFERAEPESMSFGEFELDPIRGHKLERRNRRKYKKENYEDLVYHLRYIGEKKGDIIIPEQVFQYAKEEAGKPIEGSEVHDIKAPGIMLRYDSVLTKNADDIMDRVDFGSFNSQKNLFVGLMVGVALIISAAIFLLFRRPAIYAVKETGKTKATSTGQATDEQKEILAPKYALISLSNKLFRLQADLANNPDDEKLHEIRATICNELRLFFLSYVPDLGVSEFSYEEIKAKIFRIPEKRKRELLVILTNWLEDHENILYKQENRAGLSGDIVCLRKLANDLNDWKIWQFNMREKKLRVGKRLRELLRRVR